jgi:hypothetical protein
VRVIAAIIAGDFRSRIIGPRSALSSSPGIAVRRTASLPLAYDRAIQ